MQNTAQIGGWEYDVARRKVRTDVVFAIFDLPLGQKDRSRCSSPICRRRTSRNSPPP